MYSSSCLDPLTDCVKDWLASNTWISCFVCKTSDSMLRSTWPASDQRIHALLRRRQGLCSTTTSTTLPVLTYYSCEDAIEHFATQICIRWIQIHRYPRTVIQFNRWSRGGSFETMLLSRNSGEMEKNWGKRCFLMGEPTCQILLTEDSWTPPPFWKKRT